MSEQDASRSDPGHDSQAVLVTAASLHGATTEIAEAIGKTLAEHGLATSVVPPGDVRDVGAYDAVILGSAVYVRPCLISEIRGGVPRAVGRPG